MTPVLAIADEHGRGVLKTLTLREQKQYLGAGWYEGGML